MKNFSLKLCFLSLCTVIICDGSMKKGETRLHAAVRNGNRAGVEALLNQPEKIINNRDTKGRTALHLAINHSDPYVFRDLLDNGADANIADMDGRTPLHYCFTSDYVRALIKANADVNKTDNEGRVPLHNSSLSSDIVQALVNAGADVNKANNEGRTPLHNRKSSSVVRALIDAKAEVNRTDNEGRTPLHGSNLSFDIVQALIGAKADVNKTDKQGFTPLHYSSTLDIVQALIDAGADVNKANVENCTPLHYSKSFGVVQGLLHVKDSESVGVVQALLGAKAGVNKTDNEGCTPLHYIGKSMGVVKALIRARAEVNIADNKGCTPLHCINRSSDIVQALIEAKADVHSADIEGRTPLHNSESSDVVRTLLDAKADVNKTDSKGRTSLHNSESSDVVRTLLDAKADVNKTDNKGRTSLHNSKSSDVVRTLIDAKADINKTDNKGRTSLHTSKSLDVVQTLIYAKADINKTDSKGRTSLHNSVVVQALIDAKADVNKTDNEGRTLLHYTAEKKDSLNQFMALCRLGGVITMPDNESRTPLDIARINKRRDIVDYYSKLYELLETLRNDQRNASNFLVDEGASNARFDHGRTLLHSAAEFGRADYIRVLLDNGARLMKDDEGNTPLHIAAEKNNVDVLKLLLNKTTQEADFNTANNQGRKPLHDCKSIDAAKALINARADVNAIDSKGKTPLYFSQSAEIVKTLIGAKAQVHFKDKQYKTPLHDCKSIDVAKALINARADVNAIDSKGRTSLYFSQSAEIVKTLIGAKADVNSINPALIGTNIDVKAVDEHGRTLLHDCKSIDVVQALIQAKANVNTTDTRGRTPLHNSKTLENVVALIDAGADVNSVDNDGHTPLHYYAEEDSLEQFIALCSRGGIIGMPDNEGITPLDFARKNSCKDIINYYRKLYKMFEALRDDRRDDFGELFDKGGSNAKFAYGKTLLHHAAALGRAYYIQILFKAGAQFLKDDKGNTPLHAASRKHNVDVMKLLLDGASQENINAQNEAGDTALHLCTEMPEGRDKTNAAKIVSLLLKKGAQANISDGFGQTPVYRLLSFTDEYSDVLEKCLKLLVDDKPERLKHVDSFNRFILYYAIERSKRHLTRLILQMNKECAKQKVVPVDVPLLHLACKLEDDDLAHEFVRMLLNTGVDANTKDVDERTALFSAVQAERPALIEDLFKYGANLSFEVDEIYNSVGKIISPLFLAALKKQDDLIKVLVQHGARINGGEKVTQDVTEILEFLKKKLGEHNVKLGEFKSQNPLFEIDKIEENFKQPLKTALADL